MILGSPVEAITGSGDAVRGQERGRRVIACMLCVTDTPTMPFVVRYENNQEVTLHISV